MKSSICVWVLFGFSGLLMSCGGGRSDSPTPPSIRDSLTPEQRARYCFLNVNLDADPAQQDYLKQIQGTWVHEPQGPTETFTRREFLLDLTRRIVAVTTYETWGHDVEDITYKKICVGQPLDASFGAYAGYRTVEMMADNNEGAAAVLVKFEASGSRVALTVSDRIYQRFNTDGLTDPRSAITNADIKNLWVYRVRQ